MQDSSTSTLRTRFKPPRFFLTASFNTIGVLSATTTMPQQWFHYGVYVQCATPHRSKKYLGPGLGNCLTSRGVSYCRLSSVCEWFFIFIRSIFIFSHHNYFPAQRVGGFVCPQWHSGHSPCLPVYSLFLPLPPVQSCLHPYHAYGLAFPLLDDFHRMLPTQAS